MEVTPISFHAKIINKKGMALSTHSETQFGLRDAPDTLAAKEFVRVQCNIDLKEQVTE
jgi:hypothetical protein